MIGLMLVTTGVLQKLMTRSINIFLRPVSAQNVRPETTACKADKRSGAADSETKPKTNESLNGTAAPSGEAPHASVDGKSASPVDVVGRPAPVNLPHQSSLVPAPAPSTDGQDAQCLTTQTGARKKVTFAPSTDDRDAQRTPDKSGARKKVTFAPSTDDRDAQRPPNKSGARKKETFGGMKPGFLSGGAAGGTKAKEAQKVGKMRRGGRRQVPAKSREATKSHKMKRAGDKKATDKKARLEQEAAAQIADMHAVASLLTAFPNARIGTSVSPAMYPLTPNIVFRAPISNE
ncbi:uncharacterized protein LOC144873136 isoform X2 [Branchiostoma floridae x Branchiostoma japonicum]